MKKLKKLPLGIQSFRKIVEGGYIYVDKTQYIYDIINEASFYFLSRPMRFGKSLFIDTLSEAFSGDRELFKGLSLCDSDYSFENHPVLRLDMSKIANRTPELLENSLTAALGSKIKEEGLDINEGAPSDMLMNLIESLHKKYGKGVVVLIDEYDKPILDRLGSPEIADANRDIIRGFYGILKPMDPCLRLTFITGVSKFTKTSIFSEMNNLYDITLTEAYSNICGIPVEDLGRHFGEHIEALASLKSLSHIDSVHDEILKWYDGYSWNGEARVINPFSLLSFLMQKRFSSFWYSSGTPKFLMELIKSRPEGYANLKNLEIGEWSLDKFDIHKMEVEPLLFQTGYLTVKEILPKEMPSVYVTDIPNFEVRLAFNLHILADFTEAGSTLAESAHRKIREALKAGELQDMLVLLRALFASIPYQLHMRNEAYYHSIFLALMSSLGFETHAEVQTARGRIDAVLEMGDKIYVIEFKYADCAPDAAPEARQALFEKTLGEGMRQIKGGGYADKYAGSGKVVYQAAFAFLGRDEIEMRVEKIDGVGSLA